MRQFIARTYQDPRLFALALGGFALLLVLVAITIGEIYQLRPCQLCYWQRGLWFGVVLCCFRAWYPRNLPFEPRLWLGVAGLVLVANAGVAFYQVGLEERWWSGGCAADYAPQTLEELKASIRAASPTSCGEAGWRLWGLSMAGWNGVIALAAALKTGVAVFVSR